jgi:amino acid transporter
MGLNGPVGTPELSPPHSLAPGRIGAAAVIFFALAATAPLSVLIFVVPGAYARGDGPLVPLAFVALAIILICFAAGYSAMAHRAPFAGAMYAYVSRGLGRPSGLAAAWVALISYTALQFGLYGVVGAAAAPLLRSWFHFEVSWWAVAAACWAVVAICGTMRIEITGGITAVLVLAEAAVIAGFAAADAIDPAGDRIPLATIVPSHPAAIDRPALGLLLAVGLLAFVGFETTGTYAEETMRPRREVGRATYVSVALLGLILAGSAWSMIVAAGPDRIAALAQTRGPELIFDLAAARLAPWAITLGRLMLVTGLLAAMLSVHHAIARYLFALGRERVFPRALGRTARRTRAPRTASLIQSVVAAAAIGYAASLPSPVVVARQVAVFGGLGILLLLLATSLAALLHLNRVPGAEGVWGRFVAPILSTVSLGTLCFLAVRNLPALLLVDPDDARRWVVPGALAALALIGLIHGWSLRKASPVTYAGIGLGGTPVVVTPQVPRPREPGKHRPERVNVDRTSS